MPRLMHSDLLRLALQGDPEVLTTLAVFAALTLWPLLRGANILWTGRAVLLNPDHASSPLSRSSSLRMLRAVTGADGAGPNVLTEPELQLTGRAARRRGWALIVAGLLVAAFGDLTLTWMAAAGR
jgi:hypothetical protein